MAILRKFLALTAIYCSLGEVASAITLDEKLCIATASQKLPSTTSFVLKNSSSKIIDVSSASQQIVGSYFSIYKAMEELDSVFYNLNSMDVSEKIRSAGPDQQKQILSDALSKRLSSAASVEIIAGIAGQEITYGFVCGWDKASRRTAIPLGAVR